MTDQTERRNTGTSLPPPNEFGSIILDDGLYLHLDHVEHVRISSDGGEGEVYVAASEFMQVQRERDELRRALAFINAWRTKPQWWEPRPLSEFLDRTLARVGLTLGDGRAMASILASSATDQPLHGGAS